MSERLNDGLGSNVMSLRVVTIVSGSPFEVLRLQHRFAKLAAAAAGVELDMQVLEVGDELPVSAHTTDQAVALAPIKEYELPEPKSLLDQPLEQFFSATNRSEGSMRARVTRGVGRYGIHTARHLMVLGSEYVDDIPNISTGILQYIENQMRHQLGDDYIWPSEVASPETMAELCDEFYQLPVGVLPISRAKHPWVLPKLFANLVQLLSLTEEEMTQALLQVTRYARVTQGSNESEQISPKLVLQQAQELKLQFEAARAASMADRTDSSL